MFREGDFDYPYRLKQLASVAPSVFYWFTQLQSTEASAQCLETALLQPVRDALYFRSLSNPRLYQTSNFAAFAAGQTAVLAALAGGADRTTAGGAGVAAFVGAGATFYSGTNPLAPTAAIDGAWLAANDASKPWSVENRFRIVLNELSRFLAGELRTNLATAIVTAALTATQLQTNWATVIQAYFSFGYWWRPAYGSHRTATAVLSTEEILEVSLVAVVGCLME